MNELVFVFPQRRLRNERSEIEAKDRRTYRDNQGEITDCKIIGGLFLGKALSQETAMVLHAESCERGNRNVCSCQQSEFGLC